MSKNYSEIQILQDLFNNEGNIRGIRSNEENLKRYEKLTELAGILDLYDQDALEVRWYPADDSSHRHGKITVSLSRLQHCEDRMLLDCISELFRICDAFSFTSIPKMPRICFSVYNIWNDGKEYPIPKSPYTLEEALQMQKEEDEFFRNLDPEDLM